MFGFFPLLFSVRLCYRSTQRLCSFSQLFHTFVTSLQMGLITSCLHLLNVEEGMCNTTTPEFSGFASCFPCWLHTAALKLREVPQGSALASSFRPEFPRLRDWHNEFYKTCSFFSNPCLQVPLRMDAFIYLWLWGKPGFLQWYRNNACFEFLGLVLLRSTGNSLLLFVIARVSANMFSKVSHPLFLFSPANSVTNGVWILVFLFKW